MSVRLSRSSVLVLAGLAAGCSSMMSPTVNNASLPESVRVPQGNSAKLWSLGVGELTYACREKADQKGAYGWAFVGPVATLYDRNKAVIGKYYSGPTWEARDGSKVTGKQSGVAPGNPGSISLQLVKATPDTTAGTFAGITYIQRLNTQGGAAPASVCDAANVGSEQKVPYQADYVFYSAG